jgi:endonuclease YncB( thermonuclease family)
MKYGYIAAGVATLVLAGCGSPAQVAAPTATPTPTPSVTSASPAAAVAPVVQTAAVVTAWIDGDTVDTDAGRVRVVGIDTPERGQCGYAEATKHAVTLAPVGTTVYLTVAKGEDKDKYGRLLRYVNVDTTDVGYEQISDGFAIARYDSRDGYGEHPREATYIAADAASAAAVTCTPTPKATPTKKATPAPTKAAAPAPAAEPFYANCSEVRAAGAAPIFPGDPGWREKFDRDKDGVGCE